MRGYSTKYALTGGAVEIDIDLEYGDGARARSDVPGYSSFPKYVYSSQSSGRQQFVTGKNFFLTRREAASAIVVKAAAKKRALIKQLTRLEELGEREALLAKGE